VEWFQEPTGQQLGQAAALISGFWQEVIPGEPAVPADVLAAELHGSARHRRVLLALCLDGGEAVGMSQLVLDDVEGRRTVGWVKSLVVRPEARRSGLGTMLLDAVVGRARGAGRTRLSHSAAVTHGAGMRFAAGRGATRGQVVEQTRVRVTDLDRELLDRWVQRATNQAVGYSIVAFDGVCPDDLLDPFTSIVDVMNTAPRAEHTEDVHRTAEQVRENMEAFARQGNRGWTVCARHDPTGELVAFTELGFLAHRPWLVAQGDTVVHPGHRRLGLGGWVKATNALRLLSEPRAAEVVETWNAADNTPMVTLNHAMGFRPVARWQEWDLTI
jgi:GNAT superfamily N-acetyltransferase